MSDFVPLQFWAEVDESSSYGGDDIVLMCNGKEIARRVGVYISSEYNPESRRMDIESQATSMLRNLFSD